jgi:uncharacterized repeat protein (TIGR01451 family)
LSRSSEANNCDTKTTIIEKFSPNLSVQKSADKATVAVGENLNYTITLSNIGDAGAASPITLTDVLDTTKVTFVNAVATNGFTCSFASPNVTCNDPGTGLQVGASTTITIQVTVNSGVTTPIVNSASVPDGTTFDSTTPPCSADPSKCENETAPNNANNSDSVSTNVAGSALNLNVIDLTDTPDHGASGSLPHCKCYQHGNRYRWASRCERS